MPLHHGRPAFTPLKVFPELLIFVALAACFLLALVASTLNTPAAVAGMLCALGVALLTIIATAAVLKASRQTPLSEGRNDRHEPQ
jgi:drug/metabolite transporter (DMT)-like permease